jgi:SAM-dependent methyltransferase
MPNSESISALYHAHHSRNTQDLAFWLQQARAFPGALLELGCGSGRVLLHLAENGCTVYGLDKDLEMLTYLRQRLTQQLSARTHIFLADFTCFRLERQFNLIIMPCNTYSTLAPEQRAKTLQQAQRHLSPGGCLVVSIPNPALLRSLPAFSKPQVEEIFPHPLDGEPVRVSSAWQRDEESFTVFWEYDHMLPGDQVNRSSLQAKHYLTPLQTYLDEFSRAGFTRPVVYGNFDRSPYSSKSQYAIIASQAQP